MSRSFVLIAFVFMIAATAVAFAAMVIYGLSVLAGVVQPVVSVEVDIIGTILVSLGLALFANYGANNGTE